MLPFVNKFVGLGSFLGVLFFATTYNNTGTIKNGVIQDLNGVRVNPVAPRSTPTTKADRFEGDDDLFLVDGSKIVESPPSPPPLELKFLESGTSIHYFKKGEWFIFCHVEWSQASQRALKLLLAFFERLSEKYNSEELKVKFAVINLDESTKLAFKLGFNFLPPYAVGMSDGSLVLVKPFDLFQELNEGKPEEVEKSLVDGSWKKEVMERKGKRAGHWIKRLERRIILRALQIYYRDQMSLVEWIGSKPIMTAAVASLAILCSCVNIKLSL